MKTKLQFPIKNVLAILFISTFAVLTVAAENPPPLDVSMAEVFDFDDTIAFSPSEIHLFEKNTGEMIKISTEDFAHHRLDIGQPGSIYEKYEIRWQIPGGSLDEFQVQGAGSYFKSAMEKMITMPEYIWQGPAFKRMVELLKTPEGAKRFYVLSARGHLPEEFYSGFEVIKNYLQLQKDIVIYLPPKEHFNGVGGGNDTASKKANVLKLIAERELSLGRAAIIFHEDDINNSIGVRSLFANDLRVRLPSLRTIINYVGTKAEDLLTTVPEGFSRFQPYLMQSRACLKALNSNSDHP